MTRTAATLLAALALALVALPGAALADGNWGFGPGGQATARITWQTNANSTRNVFTLKVKLKSAKSPQGVKCKILKRHPHQARCPVSPSARYGYINVVAKARIPCSSPIRYTARIGGRNVRQPDIEPGNACH
jgi:hypothetical protein